MSHSFLEDVPANKLTSSTIRRMYELIDQAKTDPKFQELVYGLTKGLRNKDYRGEVARIFDWAKKQVRYTRDPHGVELVQDVWATLHRGRGDCDDFTILLGAACEVMGAPCRIITVSTRPDKEPVHVYPEAKLGNKWTALDATVAGARPGWAPRRITDRVVWSRKDVGISGYDDDTIEGLGMFKSTMVPVDFGVPSDISHTFADPMPGDQVRSRRRQPGAPYFKVATNSELVQSPAPGGLPYAVPMPVEPEPLPSQNWSGIPRPSVRMELNPWPDQVREWKKDWAAMLPQGLVTEDREMSNLNGLGAFDYASLSDPEIDALTDAVEFDVTRMVKSGKIPAEAAHAAVSHAVDAVKTGNAAAVRALPATSRAVRRIARGSSMSARSSTPASSPLHPPTAGMARHGNLRATAHEYDGDGEESMDWMPGLGGRPSPRSRAALYGQVHAQVKRRLPQVAREAGVHPMQIKGLFDPRSMRGMRVVPVEGLSGLGDALPVDAGTASQAAGAITDGILRLVDPADAQAVSQAVESGMKAIVGAAPAPSQQASLLSKLNFGGWGVPALVLAAITGMAVFMSGPKKIKYRRNGSRRRSRRSYRRGGGSLGIEKYVPWALGAGAAYLILKPKAAAAAPGAPAQQGILSSIMNMFKSPSAPTSTQAAAGMVQAGANPFASIVNSLFGPSKTAAPAPASASSTPRFVTQADINGSTAPSSPESQFVTSLPADPAPSSPEMQFDFGD